MHPLRTPHQSIHYRSGSRDAHFRNPSNDNNQFSTSANLNQSASQSLVAVQAIKALQEKNYKLESEMQVMENLLKQYK